MNLNGSKYDLLFDVQRSIRYHNKRRAFFDSLNTVSNVCAVGFGSGTVFSLLQSADSQWLTASLAAGVTLVSTVNLVIGSNRMARTHHDLARKFTDLERKIRAVHEETPDLVSTWWNERLSIESEEPPVKRVLDSMCYNEMIKAMGYTHVKPVKITPTQRFFAHVFDLDVDTIA
jgi:hypothetical protein